MNPITQVIVDPELKDRGWVKRPLSEALVTPGGTEDFPGLAIRTETHNARAIAFIGSTRPPMYVAGPFSDGTLVVDNIDFQNFIELLGTPSWKSPKGTP